MLKKIVLIVFFAVIGTIFYGYYVKENDFKTGEKIIGIGVLLFAFVLMPLFIYLRYRGRDLSHYTFNQNKKEKEENIL